MPASSSDKQLPELARRIKERRKAMSLTLAEAGARIGITDTGIRQYERGEAATSTSKLKATQLF